MKRILKNKKYDQQRNLESVEEMAQPEMNAMIQQLANLQLMMQNIQAENASLRARIEQIPINPNIAPAAARRLQPVSLSYATPQEVNLDVFKALPEYRVRMFQD